MKSSKTSVGFEHPAKGPHHCSQCEHFRPPHGCEIVEGNIDPGDWCRRFRPKNNLASRALRGRKYA